MAKSLLNSSIEKIEYAGVGNDKAVVSFSRGKMLVQSAQIGFQRNIQKQHFINSGSAILIGRGQGTLTLTGLFGTAEDMKNLVGSPDNPCGLAQNISIEAGVLRPCKGDAGEMETGDPMKSTITCVDCICTAVSINTTLQQDGQLYQQATASFVVSDATVE